MTEDWLCRTRMLLGDGAVSRLMDARVALFGLGGVGGHCAEALIRSGVGHLELFDMDTVSLTNLNRQLAATVETLGQPKADALRARLLSIHPQAEILAHRMFYLPETADAVALSSFDYVIDAVDTVTAKLELAQRCRDANVPIISAMGAGNKLDPTRFRVADIAETKICPLARVMRRELKKRGIEHLKVVYSQEPPVVAGGGRTPGSTAFCPSVMGLILAGEVVRDLAGIGR